VAEAAEEVSASVPVSPVAAVVVGAEVEVEVEVEVVPA
jgi:hypothetical protein